MIKYYLKHEFNDINESYYFVNISGFLKNWIIFMC